MNTWRDIKKDPPPKGETVIACDYTTIYIGKFSYVGDDKKLLLFDGKTLSQGDPARFMADQVQKWQPAPEIWAKPEMMEELRKIKIKYTEAVPAETIEIVQSADEMFREAGWKKFSDHSYGRPCFGVSIGVNENTIDFCQGNQIVTLTIKEFQACAQLIKELQNGSD